MVRILILLMAAMLGAMPAAAASRVKVTVLSTMLADIPGRGEWGYAALVEVDGRRILFDTGAEPDTVAFNAKALGIDLADVEEVVLSHNHWDHVGGLVALRTALMARNPKALSIVHVGAGAFLPAPANSPRRDFRAAYLATGGQIREHAGPVLLAPDMWLTGPVARVHPEVNYGRSVRVIVDGREVPDTVPEDSSLVIRTEDGLIVLTGCGHAGAVNIVTAARAIAGALPVEAMIGGLHLASANAATVDWTAAQVKTVGVRHFLSGHCTGLEPTRRLAEAWGLGPDRAAYAPVGGSYEFGKGIDARVIARAIPTG
jgi:7,8-dihydropterin-6-yl-methyl-4-(beta-D-ribofuranosyl)aminobenzene 5'-phosphate synthase